MKIVSSLDIKDLNKDKLTKATAKYIKSLQRKKNRNQDDVFVVEGHKSIQEFLNEGFTVQSFYEANDNKRFIESTTISDQELRSISSLQNPQGSLAVFKQKPDKCNIEEDTWIIVLDGVQDPGNLGTIIRLADWFGIKAILCSKTTADCYNPKVVQASMGSLARTSLKYVDLSCYLNDYDNPIYGTFMDGKSIYESSLHKPGALVLGSEGNGISNEIEKLCTQKISIPQFGRSNSTESLNVAMAGSIVLGEIHSQKLRNGHSTI